MLPDSSRVHYQESQALRSATVREVRSLWGRMTTDFDLSWQSVGPSVNAALESAQAQSAASAVEYVVAEGVETGVATELAAPVNVAAFTGFSSSGAPLVEATRGAVIESKAAMARGATAEVALTAGRDWLTRFALDAVTVASSDAVSTTIAASPTTTGFVRMLNPPSCKECVILAGKWFRWNEGFQRHPGCDCRHVPAAESVAGDLTVDPYAYFNSLSKAEQDALLGEVDAQAVRDGADIYRVVNVRTRGASSGRTWQARRYDSPTVTIDDILKESGSDRGKAIKLMEENGFILPQGQVSGGAIVGNEGGSPWGFSAGAMGRGGTRKGMTQAYRDAVDSGRRDILNPATQTAAERRFHQSYLANEAVKAGRNPFSSKRPLTQAERDIVAKQWEAQLKVATSGKSTDAQVRALAEKLGLV